jgi:hypothetical protein
VKQWFTIPNIRCKGQYEVDLLAVDTTNPKKLRRYHIECGVSISGSYSKLTDKPFSTKQLKIRVKQAGQRRTIGYFIERKFNLKQVRAELRKYGFIPGNYQKIIVKWGATPRAQALAAKRRIGCGISVIFCAKSQRQVVITQPILQTIPREQFSFCQIRQDSGIEEIAYDSSSVAVRNRLGERRRLDGKII